MLDLKPIKATPIKLPPPEQITKRKLSPPQGRSNRYTLPKENYNASPIGFRKRLAMNDEEIQDALKLLSLQPPTEFIEGEMPTDKELFEEASLSLLSSRQSTNFQGHRQVTITDPKEIKMVLAEMSKKGLKFLRNPQYLHLIVNKPYRTPFTFLLTFIGHKKLTNIWGVLKRAFNKLVFHIDDIPTIGYLKHVHLGILADAFDRAVVIASEGKRKAQIHLGPFPYLKNCEHLANVSLKQKLQGHRVNMIVLVGDVPDEQKIKMPKSTWRKLGANILSFRSERIQPGVNQEPKAPAEYQTRQEMDVPDELTFQAARAAYNAFVRFTGCPRELAKQALLLERVDVLTDGGKERLRDIRNELGEVTDRLIENIPTWADLMTLKLLSKSAEKGRKAFGLAGQRIYIGGLNRALLENHNYNWNRCLKAFGAAAARSSFVAELMGVYNLPNTCDLLAGICLMAGPVNQNDIGKQFYGKKDLLVKAYPSIEPTSLLVWTLKAKTVADPIGNEEQLLSSKKKGALVDLRSAPAELIFHRTKEVKAPFNFSDDTFKYPRAYSDLNNFITGDQGEEIKANKGVPRA